MALKRVALVGAVAMVVGLVVLGVASDVSAGPPQPSATDADSLLRLFKQMRASVAAWERGGQEAARVAFAALASLNLAWLGVELLSSPGDIRAGLGKLARELVVLSVLYGLIALGPQLARQVVDFLRSAADGIAGRPGEDQVWNALQEVVKASMGLLSSGEVGYLEVLWLGLCVVVVITLVGVTGAIMLVTEGATELILGLGAIVLGGGGAIWTRFLVQNYLKFSFSAGLALYVMRFVQAFVISNLSVWAKEATGGSPGVGDLASNIAGIGASPIAGGPETIFTLLLTVIIQLVLVMAMPTVAVMLVSGGVGKVSEWAGLGAAQHLGGMGAQGLRQMASAMSGGGAARAAGGSAAGVGQGPSVLGSSGGAIPPAVSASGGGGAAREQGSGSARGVDPAMGAGGSTSDGGVPPQEGGQGSGEGASLAGGEARESSDTQRGEAASNQSGSESGQGASSMRGRESAGSEDPRGPASSRSAWSGAGSGPSALPASVGDSGTAPAGVVAGASAAPRAAGSGASRAMSGAGVPASPPSALSGRAGGAPSAAPAPAGGQSGAARGGAPAATAAGVRGGAVAATVAPGGSRQPGVQQGAARAATTARGAAGKRGEHG